MQQDMCSEGRYVIGNPSSRRSSDIKIKIEPTDDNITGVYEPGIQPHIGIQIKEEEHEVKLEEDVTSNDEQVEGDKHEPEQYRKLFIGGLNYSTTDGSLKAFFDKWGDIVDFIVMKDPRTERSRGFGFITYSRSSMVDKAMANRPHTIDGRVVESKRVVPRDEINKPELGPTVKKLFIGGIKNMKKKDLRQYFEQYGRIQNITMPVNKKTGKQRGFAFVEFDDYDAIDKIVLKSKRHTINGRTLDVKKGMSKKAMAEFKGGRDSDRSWRRNALMSGGNPWYTAGGVGGWSGYSAPQPWAVQTDNGGRQKMGGHGEYGALQPWVGQAYGGGGQKMGGHGGYGALHPWAGQAYGGGGQQMGGHGGYCVPKSWAGQADGGGGQKMSGHHGGYGVPQQWEGQADGGGQQHSSDVGLNQSRSSSGIKIKIEPSDDNITGVYKPGIQPHIGIQIKEEKHEVKLEEDVTSNNIKITEDVNNNDQKVQFLVKREQHTINDRALDINKPMWNKAMAASKGSGDRDNSWSGRNDTPVQQQDVWGGNGNSGNPWDPAGGVGSRGGYGGGPMRSNNYSSSDRTAPYGSGSGSMGSYGGGQLGGRT